MENAPRNQSNHMQHQFKFVDLFCGIGGFHVALKRLGGECVFASDIDEKCQDVYAANFGMRPVGDITAVNAEDVPTHDVLCGGFPCQGFSNAGHRLGLLDYRGTLFYEIARIVEHHKPRILLLENVKHILTIQDGEVLRTILETFRNLGYAMKTVTMSPDEFGIPQNRQRVYFMGVRGAEDVAAPPAPVNAPVEILQRGIQGFDVKEEIKLAFDAWTEALPVIREAGVKHPVLIDYFYNFEEDLSAYPAWERKYIQQNRALHDRNPEFWDEWVARHCDILEKRAVYRKLEWQVGEILDGDTMWNHFIQLRQSGMRVKKATFFPTLVAMVQTPIYGPEKRFLTPRECARLQSFPDEHILHAKNPTAYKQLGNSVNVNVVEHIMRHLLTNYIE